MSKPAFWVIALTAYVFLDVKLAGAQRPQPVLAIGENSPTTNWTRVMYFPDANERPQQGIVLGQGYYFPAEKKDMFFKLYTRKGPKEGENLSIGNVSQLRRSTFNHSQPTFIITHGYLSTIYSETIQDIKNMYIGFKEGNVVAVDWSRVAISFSYYIAKNQTVHVGAIVAEFVDFLSRWGHVDLQNVHLTGHSLGAHVMGIAGKKFKSPSNRIGRITGLDPAGPLFSVDDREHRLDREDAKFVDVIHTCAGSLGFSEPIGQVDFYPNGGTTPQPGCTTYYFASICSHSRSWRYFAESINTLRFASVPCASYDDFKRKECDYPLRAPMGDPAPTRIFGDYFLNTAASPPFALG